MSQPVGDHEEIPDCARIVIAYSASPVIFALHEGYATVIESQEAWPKDFGRDVLEGILEHEDAGIPLNRRRKEPFERLQARVLAVSKKFEPFDWTKQI